jgi:multicomponent K+:H+ antiporter subunit E
MSTPPTSQAPPPALRRWLPHPVLSVVLLVFWLWLNSSLAAAHLVLGALAGVAIPWFTNRFWPEQVRVAKPLGLIPFAAMVLRDIVIANVVVALPILGPNRSLRPSFVVVPVELDNDFALTTLAAVISLTPGTVSADVTPDRDRLLVHSLNTADRAALVETIKNRYERPLKEIFGC